MIKVQNVSKIYGSGTSCITAVNDVTMEIPDGKFVAIVGKSGCGKSTLLNLIGGLDSVTDGTIEIDGVKITSLDKNKLAQYRNKDVGYIFQAFYLEPDLSVLDNVEMPLTIAGVDKKRRKSLALEVLTKLGIEDKASQKAKNLSGGQKQRVCIARALVTQPKLILADEPTGNLDKKNGEEVMQILLKESAEGRTIILVTHNSDDAKKADYIIEMADGQIISGIGIGV